MIVQHDGFILNPKQWTDEFRKKRKEAYNKTYLNKALSRMHGLYQKIGNIDVTPSQIYMQVTNTTTILINCW